MQAESWKFAEAMDKDGNEIISKKEVDGLREYAENELVFAYRGVGDYFSHIFPQTFWNFLETFKGLGLNYEEDEDNSLFIFRSADRWTESWHFFLSIFTLHLF